VIFAVKYSVELDHGDEKDKLNQPQGKHRSVRGGPIMASECYVGVIPLNAHTQSLPLPSERCVPEEGICYYSLTNGEGQATAQLGCWPSQTSMKLAWYGVPGCKNEFGRKICLCHTETLCNNKLPAEDDMSPIPGDLQGLVMVLLVLLLGFMLVIVMYNLIRHFKKLENDFNNNEEQGFDNDTSYLQVLPVPYSERSTYLNCTSSSSLRRSPAPLLKYNSAPPSVPTRRAHHVRDLGAMGAGAVFAVTNNFVVRNQNKDIDVVIDKVTKPAGHSDKSLMNLAFVEGNENVPKPVKIGGKVTEV